MATLSNIFIDETHNYLHAQKEYLGSFKKSK